ncbi:MAG TPA: hypothetical protein VKV23_09190 [Acidimicrobiales bacterium]|jgi:hypothetical protein|nr:hypothetical protein [Acidimicrobiales bacterium]
MVDSVLLPGIDGANPLGFLAALGVVVVLGESADEAGAALAWRFSGRWVPVLIRSGATEDEVAHAVAACLAGRSVAPEAEERRRQAEKTMERAKRAAADKLAEIRGRRLRGAERREALAREQEPLQRAFEEARRSWLAALAAAVPRPELALGRRIDCTVSEYREHASAFAGQAHWRDREALDLLAAFGTDAGGRASSSADDVVSSTPFCFITGSGHQYFLDTARALVDKVGIDGVRRVLFEPWDYRDEGLSMRWDPIEDRRYALMDRDPTAPGNKARTMWMANLLAYRALALFPMSAVGSRVVATGWDESGRSFTWPIWGNPLERDGIRSILQLRELAQERPNASVLAARGISVAYRADRITVGDGMNRKVNFAPARRVA